MGSLSLWGSLLSVLLCTDAPKDCSGGRSDQSTLPLVASSFANRRTSRAGVQVVSQPRCIPWAWSKERRARTRIRRWQLGIQTEKSRPGDYSRDLSAAEHGDRLFSQKDQGDLSLEETEVITARVIRKISPSTCSHKYPLGWQSSLLGWCWTSCRNN